MDYAQSADVEARYSNRVLIQLTDDDAQSIQRDKINAACHDASVEMDQYLATRFLLPLTDKPEVLTRICVDIAIYRLQTLRPEHDNEDSRGRYKDAVAMLEKVRDGKLNLGLTADTNTEAPPATITTVLASASSRHGELMNRNKLRGF